MQTSELMCLGAGAAALALLTCRRGPAAYRASTECSAYRAEVAAPDEADAASARRAVTDAPVWGAPPAPEREWTDAFDGDAPAGSWEDAFKGDGPPAAPAKKLPPAPPKPIPAMVESRNGKKIGHTTANTLLRDAVYGAADQPYKPVVTDAAVFA